VRATCGDVGSDERPAARFRAKQQRVLARHCATHRHSECTAQHESTLWDRNSELGLTSHDVFGAVLERLHRLLGHAQVHGALQSRCHNDRILTRTSSLAITESTAPAALRRTGPAAPPQRA
jgi:hypothetical protein